MFFIGVGSSDSEDEDDVRVRQEIIHQELIGEIYGNNSEYFSNTPNHMSIEAPKSTPHSEVSTVRISSPNNLNRRIHHPIQEVRQDLRDNLRQEMIILVNRSWE